MEPRARDACLSYTDMYLDGLEQVGLERQAHELGVGHAQETHHLLQEVRVPGIGGGTGEHKTY